MTHSTITQLPKGLKVGGIIYADKTYLSNIDEIPKDVITSGILTNNKLIINPNLPINNDLDLSKSTINSLPKGLKVNGNLNIKKSRLAVHSDNGLLEMIGDDGYIKGSIIRY